MSLFHAKLGLVSGLWDSMLPDICKSRPVLMTVQIYQLFSLLRQTRSLPLSSDEPNNQQEDMWYLPCGPGWREGGGGGRMGEGLLQRDASSALVTRQLCNSAEAEVGEAVRSPLFTHQPISPQMPNTQTLRDPTFSGELLLVQHVVHSST